MMNKIVTLEDINQEIIRREIQKRQEKNYLRDNLWEYCKEYDPDFFIDDKTLLKDVATKLQLVKEGKIKKLAISIYPRAGKSYLVSNYCAWILGNHPTGCVMRNTYGDHLAHKFSYDVRQMIRSDLFKTAFEGIKLSKSKKSLDCWALTTSKQYAYFGSGVRGTTTGYGCNLAGIVDDPIKNMADAMSPNQLEIVWDWYYSIQKTRYESNPDTGVECPTIVISTMWSKGDLINRLIDLQGTVEEGGLWTFVSYPALNEQDESSCEAMMSTEKLHTLRDEYYVAGEEFIWETMYMNKVVQKYGALFPKSALTFLDKELFPQDFDAIIGWCDPADKGTNWTCSVIIGIKNGLAYILDIIYTRKSYEYYKPLLVEQIIKFLPNYYVVESNKDGRIIAVEIRQEVGKILDNMRLERPDKVFEVTVGTKTQSKNKELRIMLNSNLIKTMFIFPRLSYNNNFYGMFIKDLTEYLAEGNNEFDDAPDTLAGLASLIKPKNSALVEVINAR